MDFDFTRELVEQKKNDKEHLKIPKDLFDYIPQTIFWEMFLKSSAYDYFETVMNCMPDSWNKTRKKLKERATRNKFMDSYYIELTKKADIKHNIINAQISEYFKNGRLHGRYRCCKGAYRFCPVGRRYYIKTGIEPYKIK